MNGVGTGVDAAPVETLAEAPTATEATRSERVLCSRCAMQELADFFGWVGTTIEGKYRVDEVVGEGGFGIVYRGHHLGFDEAVAIKCLKVPATMSAPQREAFRATFIEEGRLLHRLSRASANIIQALDVGAVLSPTGVWAPYLVLEWLRGVPLNRDFEERRARGEPRLPLADAIALLAPAARALDVAHRQGVAHRDVKPANLFITEVGSERTLKVLDFGIAKVMGDVASTTQAMAETGKAIQAFSPQYGAPEQFNRGFGATGPWTDVFALALVLIEAASGRLALGVGDFMQLYIAATDRAHRPSLGGLGVSAPAAVEAALQRAVAVEPRERFRNAGELWDALERARKSTVPPSLHDVMALADTFPTPPDRGIAPQAPVAAKPKAKDGAPKAQRDEAQRDHVLQPAQKDERPPRVTEKVVEEPELRVVRDTVDGMLSLSVHGMTPQAIAFEQLRSTLFIGFDTGWVLCLDLTSKRPRWWRRIFSTALCVTVGAGWLAVGCGDGSIRMLDSARGTMGNTLPGQAAVRGLDMHRGRQLLAACDDDRLVTLWSVTSGERLYVGKEPSGRVLSVTFATSSAVLASGASDGTVRLWDPALALAPMRVLRTDGGSVRGLSFSPGGNFLAAGCDDGTIRLWGTRRWQLKNTLTDNSKRVVSVAFNSHGNALVSGSSDGMVRVWEVPLGKALGVLGEHNGAIQCVATSLDGRHVASAGADGMVRVYRWPNAT